MDVRKETTQREKFKGILFDLARSQEILKPPSERAKFYCRFEELYYKTDNGKDFRHFYSDIFAVLTQIRSDESKGSSDILGQNLSLIRQGYQSTNKDSSGDPIDVSDSIKKLYDHVSLDIARIAYTDASDRKIISEDSIKNAQAEIITLKNRSSKLLSGIKKLEKILKNSQKEYIAILGIFAAIVLSFTGGIAFSSSTLQAVRGESIYLLIITILLVGFVLINILFALFFYIDRIVNSGGLCKTRFIYIIDAIILLLVLATILCWNAGCAEKRDARIKTDLSTYYQSSSLNDSGQ